MKKLTENGIDFAYLSITDVDEIEAAIKKEQADALNAQLDAIKDLKPEQRLALWQQNRRDVTVDDIYWYVRNTYQGAVKALTLAFKRADNGKDAVLETNMANAGNLAAHLMGFEDRVPFAVAVKPPSQPPSESHASEKP